MLNSRVCIDNSFALTQPRLHSNMRFPMYMTILYSTAVRLLRIAWASIPSHHNDTYDPSEARKFWVHQWYCVGGRLM